MNRLRVVICAVALLCSVLFADAGHLKGHTQKHHKASPQRHRHHKDHYLPGVPQRWLDNNFAATYAVCVFHHESNIFVNEDFSIGFFDQTGELLYTHCGELFDFGFDNIVRNSRDANDWSIEEIDGVSKCYVHKDEEKDAVTLMGSYSCDD